MISFRINTKLNTTLYYITSYVYASCVFPNFDVYFWSLLKSKKFLAYADFNRNVYLENVFLSLLILVYKLLFSRITENTSDCNTHNEIQSTIYTGFKLRIEYDIHRSAVILVQCNAKFYWLYTTKYLCI